MKPVILSTGMNNIDQIRKTVKILDRYGVQYALLHTTNLYPTPPHLVRLGAMQELQKNFPDAVVGLSDHTTSNHACFAATALGASILERHFTDSMDRQGPDIVNSMDPSAMKELISGCSDIALMRGGRKVAVREEQVTIDFAFATVVTIKPIKKGEKLTEENIWVKRPGTGEISAEFFYDVIGRKMLIDVNSDIHLNWGDLSDS